jgi:predicted Na+-dependent transporter
MVLSLTTLYLYALVVRDYITEDCENMEKSYQKAVSLTYATAYVATSVALAAIAFISNGVQRAYLGRFLTSLYMSIICAYLASPKVRP